MLGLPIHSNKSLEQLATVISKSSLIHWPTVALSLAVLAFIFGMKRLAPKLPGSLIAVLGSIALSAAASLGNHGIEVIGPVAGGLPNFSLPPVSWDDVNALMPIAGACFVMILAQSSVTARAYATKHQQTLDENRDLLGLSTANIAAGLTGTFVVNGSPTQTAMVDACGGRSQVVHLSTAATVAFVLILLTGPLKFLPLCVLGAIVFVVATGLVDIAGMRNLWKFSRREFYLALMTAASVVFIGVEQGICLALVLSILQHLQHSYRPHTAVIVYDPVEHWQMGPATAGVMLEPGMIMYWFGADLYYANATFFVTEVRRLVTESPTKVRWLVVDVSAITAIDFSASRALIELQQDLSHHGVVLALTRMNASLQANLKTEGVTDVIGEENIFQSRKHCMKAYKALPPISF
jgi:MFS superfamily sulfate permease-like transporter